METTSFVYIIGDLKEIKEREGFKKGFIVAKRSSGVEDKIPFECGEDIYIEEGRARIAGKLQTRNVRDKKGKSHKQMFVRVTNYCKISVDSDELGFYEASDKNQVEMTCCLVKKENLRQTPSGKIILDIVVAVNEDGRSHYPSCIVWGSVAEKLYETPVGTTLGIRGRFQSRDYIKEIENVAQVRTAYEISVSSLEEY